jgi:hypothetical protein
LVVILRSKNIGRLEIKTVPIKPYQCPA